VQTEVEFLSEIGTELSDALWSEPELAKKQALFEAISEKLSHRILALLPPGTPMMG
jgi:hypothetical protein